MGRHLSLFAFVACVSTPALFSCGAAPTSATSTGSGAASSGDSTGFAVADLSRPAVDASTLAISTFEVVPMIKNGLTRGHVTAFVSGDADYVELVASTAGSSSSNTWKLVATRFLLPAFGTEKVILTVRPCVDAARAKTSVQCGAAVQQTFLSNNIDVAAIDIASQIAAKQAELKSVAAQSKAALAGFSASLAQCSADAQKASDLNAVKGLVTNFLATGDLQVQNFFQPAALLQMLPQSDVIGALVSQLPVANLAAPLQNILGSFQTSVKNDVTGIANSIPLFSNAANPMQALSSFGSSLFDLIASNSLVHSCATPELSGIVDSLNAITTDLKNLEAQGAAHVSDMPATTAAAQVQ